MAEFLLSPQQRRIWLLQENTGKNLITKCCLKIDGLLNNDRVAAVLRNVSLSHDVLRTRFAVKDELEFPLQVVPLPDDSSISYDYFDREDNCSDEWIKEFYEQDKEFFDFFTSQQPGIKYYLVKRSSGTHYLIIKALSLLLDGYSLRQLVESILTTLNEGKGDAAGSNSSDEISYVQFAEWQQRSLEDDTITYWKDAKFQSPENLQLQVESTAKDRSPERADVFFMLPDDLKEKLDIFINERQLTAAQFFYACWNILLSRLAASKEFISGYTDYGKEVEELEPVWGALAKILPVWVSLDEAAGFETVAAALIQELTDMEEWKDYYLLENNRGKDRKDNQLAYIPYLFGYLDFRLNAETRQPLLPELIWFQSGFEKYKALLNVVHENGGYRVQLEFNAGYFSKEEAKRMLSYFRQLIKEVLAAPERPIAELEMLDDEEKHLILDVFNRKTVDIPQSSIITLFESQVRRNGDITAIVAADGEITYRALNEEANRLAHFLRDKYKVKPGDLVAILTDRSTDMIKAMTGILKAGAAYLPIDASWPAGRIAELLSESKCRMVITQPDLIAQLPKDIEVIVINDRQISTCDNSDPSIITSGSDLAYVIFTSGSTGKPKGVMIDHETVINLCYGLKHELNFPEMPGTRFSLFASAAFDASVQQVFSCLLGGNSLYIISDEVKKDIDQLTRFLRDNRIAVFDCTPAVLSLLLEEAAEEFRNSGVQKVLVGGDAWTDKLLKMFNREGFDRSSITFYNVYGPTECGVDSTVYRLKEGDGLSAIPIGTPLPNKHIYILDNSGKPVPIGISGEIFIGGKGISPGYLNRDDLSRELFIDGPVNGERLYKSGDLGKWLPDGSIVFMGRKDEQLKIRGYRVEPGEIAAALLGYEGVGEAIVYMSEKEGEQRSLTAAIVPDKKKAYTLHRIKALEELDPGAANSLYKLPNGLPVWYANKSELDLIYDEIFVDQVYLQYKINVKAGDVVFDVGANIGFFSLFMGLHYPGIRLYAFEPVGAVHDILQKNLSLYPIEYKTFNTGISDKEGNVKFNYYPLNTVLSGRYGNVEEERGTVENYLRNRSGSNGHPLADSDLKTMIKESVESIEIDCRMRRLSDIIKEENIDRIDLLKIDVEKSEMDVINGIDEKDWSKIRQVFIEVHDRDGVLATIMHALKKHGFEVDVQQDPLLVNTCIYNVYAVRAGVPTAANAPAKYEGWVDEKALIGSIREYMVAKLPAYMLPADYLLVSKIPLNSNGKVDVAALKELEGSTKGEKEITARPENEIEELLLKVWKEVLGKTDISVNDDFFMVGGDSIKAIQISSRVHKAGYKVTIRDILNHSILSELAPQVKKIKKAIPQDEIRGAVPLVPAQHAFFAQNRKHPNYFNLPMLFYSADRIDLSSIKAIFTHLWSHHDALRMVFSKSGGQWQQENKSTELTFELKEYEFSAHTVLSDVLQKEMEALQSSIDLEKGPLMKVGLFHTAKGDRLLVIIHHLVVDGVSWRILFEDIETLLRQYRANISFKLPDKTHSFKEWAENLAKYANSNELLQERNYWAGVENEPVDYLDTKHSKDNNTMKDTAYVSYWLAERDTAHLLTTANKVFNTRINDILLSALSISLRKTWRLSKVAITMEGHGREGILGGLEINRTVGWFTSLYPLVLYAGHEKDLPEQIKEMKKQLNAIPNNGVGYGILKFLTDKKNLPGIDFRIKPEISFNYLGQFDEDIRQLTMEATEEPFGAPYHQENNRDHLLDIVAKVSGKTLSFQICYNSRHFTEEKIREFGECYKTTLHSIAEHCAVAEVTTLASV